MPESVSDRPTRSHEFVFLLAKRGRYYYDAEAIRESATQPPRKAGPNSHANVDRDPAHQGRKQDAIAKRQYVGFNDRYDFGNPSAGRNKRTVWTIATQPFPGAHFATFPEVLVTPCIQAGTSEWGCCPECGAPWARVVERKAMVIARSGARPGGSHDQTVTSGTMLEPPESRTVGWRPTCKHEGEPVPCLVLDPFSGSGTVGIVAQKAGRRAVLIDVSPEYCAMARERLRQAVLL